MNLFVLVCTNHHSLFSSLTKGLMMPDISYWAAEDWLYQVLAPSHILYLASRAAAGASGWKDVAQTLLERADCWEGVTFITGLESREKDSTDQHLSAWKLQGDKRETTHRSSGTQQHNSSSSSRPEEGLSESRPDISRYQKPWWKLVWEQAQGWDLPLDLDNKSHFVSLGDRDRQWNV